MKVLGEYLNKINQEQLAILLPAWHDGTAGRYKEMSSIFAEGEGGGVRGLSQWAQLCDMEPK
jgi:hypothetical protein